MSNDAISPPEANPQHDRLRTTLERLLEIDAIALADALGQAALLIAEALGAAKVDAFLHQPAIDTLVALGVSDTPMGQRQKAIGMDRLPIANGGRTVQVFQTGTSFRSGQLDQDPEELRGTTEGLGARSMIAVVLRVANAPSGVLQALSAQSDAF